MSYGNNYRIKNICPDTMLNHQLFQKFKLMKNNEFNYLINILTKIKKKGADGRVAKARERGGESIGRFGIQEKKVYDFFFKKNTSCIFKCLTPCCVQKNNN